jgi:hypothetical protein
MTDMEAAMVCLANAPMCVVALDGAGKATACNDTFVEHMGELYKFANVTFAEAGWVGY